MNDFSAKYTSFVREQVTAKFPGCFVTTAPVNSKDRKLPALYLRYEFPSPTPGTEDSSGAEAWTRTKVTAEAYSGTSMQEAKSIIAVADEAFYRLGFRRSNLSEVPNADTSIRRVTATWRASVDATGTTANW
nr:MAG TPA: hypothetical protein [Caudoviricetes sp.]